MGIFHVRKYRSWPVVLPLYDGRACPDCCAVVIGGAAAVIAHRDWHVMHAEWQEQMGAAVRQVAEHAGLTVGEGDAPVQLDMAELGVGDEQEYRRVAVTGRRHKAARNFDDDEDWED